MRKALDVLMTLLGWLVVGTGLFTVLVCALVLLFISVSAHGWWTLLAVPVIVLVGWVGVRWEQFDPRGRY